MKTDREAPSGSNIDKCLVLIARAIREHRLSHAYLVVGPPGSGKKEFMEKCAGLLLCNAPDLSSHTPGACMSCNSCHKFQKRVHPDALDLAPQGQYIKIGQVREMQKILSFAPLESKRRVCTITDANRLNADASNALLKTLEEPPEGTYLLLAATSTSRLLPTIVSRCQIISIRKRQDRKNFDEKMTGAGLPMDAMPFLGYVSDGNPEIAVQLADAGLMDIRNIIMQFLTSEYREVLFFTASHAISHPRENIDMAIKVLYSIIRDLILIMSHKDNVSSLLANQDRAEELAKLAQETNYDSLFSYRRLMEQAERYLERNVNPEMTAEMLLTYWLQHHTGTE